MPNKGRTIRKVMGGGGGEGDFQLARFFFSPSACAGIFFAGETLCTNFFFQRNILNLKVNLMVKNKRAKQGRIFDPLSDINTAKTFERCPCRRDTQQLTRFQENRNCSLARETTLDTRQKKFQ